ncbi:MAG TPA: TerB family tellurite resistance protein [Chryseosolibacter sp.]
MRKRCSAGVLIFLLASAHAQTHEATQLMLNYEKLKQLEEILDNMYKGYLILSKGYNRIKSIAEGNYNLHQAYLDALNAVNPSLASHRRIADIVSYQSLLMKEYRLGWTRFRNDPNLTREEVAYLLQVYSSLVDQSLGNLEELTMVATANKLRMSDDSRLQSIERIYIDIESKLSFLRYFNNSVHVLVMQRAKESSEVGVLGRLYELE